MNEEFKKLADQPDDLLKEGLKSIDSRLLKTALLPEPEEFIDRLLRGNNKAMLMMLKDDLDELRAAGKETPQESQDAQQKIVTLFTSFLQRK